MVFCPDCGNQMSDNAKFCIECGSKLQKNSNNNVRIEENVIQRSKIGSANVGSIEINPTVTQDLNSGFVCGECGLSSVIGSCDICGLDFCKKHLLHAMDIYEGFKNIMKDNEIANPQLLPSVLKTFSKPICINCLLSQFLQAHPELDYDDFVKNISE